MAELCNTPELKADVMEELKIVGGRAGLQSYEQVRDGHPATFGFAESTGGVSKTASLILMEGGRGGHEPSL